MFKRVIFTLFILALILPEAFSFDLLMDVNYKKPFEKMKERKNRPIERIRMVETVDEWEEKSQNVPVEEREHIDFKQPESTKTYYFPQAKYRFEKYNYPAGSKESNISEIKAKYVIYSPLVADINCRFVAYAKYYYTPDIDQISSNFYVEKLDTTKTKTKRLVDFDPVQIKDRPVLQSGTKDLYRNLFNSFTVVDWNNSSNLVLLKEKTGSTLNGIYKTTLYVHFPLEGYSLRLSDFDKNIKDYYFDSKNLDIDKYRYEINPLGFDSENDSVILAHYFIFDKDNNKIFLGTWAYNCITNETILISKDEPLVNVSANGLILKQVTD